MRPAEDLITVLTEDHHEIRQLFTELQHLSQGEPLRRRLIDQLIIELVRHSVAEECYFYPLVVDRLPDGAQEAERALAEHRELERYLQRLERPGLSEDRLSRLLGDLAPAIHNHLLDEEETVFPRLARLVSEDELVKLGRLAIESKANAPSRDRGSDRPLLQTLLETGAGLVDRLRAYLCGKDHAYPGPR